MDPETLLGPGGPWCLLVQLGERVPFFLNIANSGHLLFACINERGTLGKLFVD
jgi:hypothetical protein